MSDETLHLLFDWTFVLLIADAIVIVALLVGSILERIGYEEE